MSSKTAQQASTEVFVDPPKLPDRFADESYKLFSQVKVEPPTVEEANRIRKKNIRWILPFLCVGYHLMYLDKQTVRSPFSWSVAEGINSCLIISYLSLEAPPFSGSSRMDT